MKNILIILLSLTFIGCASVNERGETVTKSGPFTTLEKHPDQKKNLEEAPTEWIEPCEIIIPGSPSSFGCEKPNTDK